jgi:hypothetical protein
VEVQLQIGSLDLAVDYCLLLSQTLALLIQSIGLGLNIRNLLIDFISGCEEFIPGLRQVVG